MSEKLLIIGIHGLANKPPESTLKDWWRNSIIEGLAKTAGIANPDLDFEMVYWADILYRNPQHLDPAFKFDELYNDEPYEEAADGALKPYKEGWADEARRIATKASGKALDLVKSNMSVNIVANWVLEKTLRDLAFYYDESRELQDPVSGQMEEARVVLMNVLARGLEVARGRKTVLVSHSMGSIIAYDVLRDLGMQDDKFDIEHFVTIGSPLGLPHVKVNILEERKDRPGAPLRTPTVVSGSWTNFADRADPVALDSHLSDDFDVNDRGVVVRDDLVSNDYERPGAGSHRNHHKSYGYLRTPEFTHHIADLL